MYRVLHNRNPDAIARLVGDYRTFYVRTTRGSFYVTSTEKMFKVLEDIEKQQLSAKKQNYRYQYFDVLGIDEVSNELIGTAMPVDKWNNIVAQLERGE